MDHVQDSMLLIQIVPGTQYIYMINYIMSKLLSGFILESKTRLGKAYSEFCTQNTPNSVIYNELIFGGCTNVYWLFINKLNRNQTIDINMN